jgi:hypothetical protein
MRPEILTNEDSFKDGADAHHATRLGLLNG